MKNLTAIDIYTIIAQISLAGTIAATIISMLERWCTNRIAYYADRPERQKSWKTRFDYLSDLGDLIDLVVAINWRGLISGPRPVPTESGKWTVPETAAVTLDVLNPRVDRPPVPDPEPKG